MRDEESIFPKLTYFKLPQLWNIFSIVVTFEKFIIDKSIDTNFVQLWKVCIILTREEVGIFPNLTSINSPQPKNIAIKLGALEKSNLDKSTDCNLEHPWNNTSTFVGLGTFVSPNVTFCKSEQPKNIPYMLPTLEKSKSEKSISLIFVTDLNIWFNAVNL